MLQNVKYIIMEIGANVSLFSPLEKFRGQANFQCLTHYNDHNDDDDIMMVMMMLVVMTMSVLVKITGSEVPTFLQGQ